MTSPSHELATIVVDRLAAEKLITADDAKKMAVKYAEGKLRQEDWRLSIEKGLDAEGKP
ncbi:MAG: hypothetical protein HGA96_00155 [Desulfobulbaceae bacterium]|nr:hypothetical protein [Desulfobulbaceae bacterium]